jgi:hypothetical protein
VTLRRRAFEIIEAAEEGEIDSLRESNRRIEAAPGSGAMLIAVCKALSVASILAPVSWANGIYLPPTGRPPS